MNLPRGYVGFTVPFPLEFNTNAIGLVKPSWSQAMREYVASLGNSPIYGFDYMLLFHNELNGGPQLFPNDTTVHQHVILDGLAEFDDGTQIPLSENYFEEFALVGELAEDHHAFITSPDPTDTVVRIQLNLAYASAVVPRVASWDNGNAYIELSASEQAEHGDSLTFVIGLFYSMDIGLGTPVHRMDWNAQTIDPARGREITWDSGNFHYEGNSPARLVEGPASPQLRWRNVCHQAMDWSDGEGNYRVTLESYVSGPGQSKKAVRIRGPRMNAQVVINGPAETLRLESNRLFLGNIEFVLNDNKRYEFSDGTISVPRKEHIIGVANTQSTSKGKIILVIGNARQFRYAHKLLADFIRWPDSPIRNRNVTHVLKDNDGDIIALANPLEPWSPRSSSGVIDDINDGRFEYWVARSETQNVKIHVVVEKNHSYLRTAGDDIHGNNLDELPILVTPRVHLGE